MVAPRPAYALGWTVRLRKPHPCGGSDWTVVRVGADIGLACLTCRKRVTMRRSEADRRLKSVVSAGAGASATPAAESAPTARHSH